jgi:hypothetical protein
MWVLLVDMLHHRGAAAADGQRGSDGQKNSQEAFESSHLLFPI